MNNPEITRRTTVNVNIVVAAAAGVAFGVVSYAAGIKTGFKLRSLSQELIAHQMIVTRLREDAPELVDATVKTVVEQMNAVLAAAN